ncbi:hypothetical protein BVG19_g415 [[Candida] boidinii]|nr:hypothetical protein BVG19_g415 [[Candida] boidinii]OWB50208.1 hypothetical protein B5S27_g1756 [[Candida] boidinii]
MICVKHCQDPDLSKREYFEQPVLQTLQMFIGEMLCWIPVLINFIISKAEQKNKNFSRNGETQPLLTDSNDYTDNNDNEIDESFNSVQRQELKGWASVLLALPALCDLLGTTLFNVGLLLTPVSIYQMTRGSLILFVGLFSVLFLKRTISRIEWSSLFIVSLGVFIVGLSGSLSSGSSSSSSSSSSLSSFKFVTTDVADASRLVSGMFLIFLGMIFSASQFVIEEYILSRLSMKPMKLVGYEGLYGALITFTYMITTHLMFGTRAGRGGPFDIIKSFNQMIYNPSILYSSIFIMICISTFNYCGISLTENLSATARSTIDTSRTLLVWLVSLVIGWESFKLLQLFGFVLLVFGTLVFNGVIAVRKETEFWSFLPDWLFEDEPHSREDLLINVVDEQIERL